MDNQRATDFQRILAAIFILVSLCGFLLAIYLKLYGKESLKSGILPALSFLMLVVGLVFFFPDMLKSSSESTVSTMRMGTLVIVLMFAFVQIKQIWDTDDIHIDENWKYILGLVFAGKAVQSISETNSKDKEATAAPAPVSSAPSGSNPPNEMSPSPEGPFSDVDAENPDPDSGPDKIQNEKNKLSSPNL